MSELSPSTSLDPSTSFDLTDGHPNPERFITFDELHLDSGVNDPQKLSAFINEKLEDAQRVSAQNDGVGVELNLAGGFNIAMVHADSDLKELRNQCLRNMMIVRESMVSLGRGAIESSQTDTSGQNTLSA